MNKDELVKELDAAVKRSVASWQDIYDMLNSAYNLMTSHPSQFSTMVAIIWHRAFAKALELLPEESDAVNIALKMNHVAVYDLLQDDDTPTRSDVDHLIASLFRQVEEVLTKTEQKDEEKPAAKRVLH